MSDAFRLGPGVLLILAAAGGGSGPAAAQTMAQQRARVDSLSARLMELESRVDSLARLEDTVEVGHLRFVVPPERRAVVENAAPLALAELERRFGAVDRRLLDGWVYRLGVDPWATDQIQRTVNAMVNGAGYQRLASLGGHVINAWSGAWWDATEHDLEAAYLGLVTSPSVQATHCFEGGTESCAKVLGLVTVEDPWTELFDDGGRRIWITRRLAWLGWATFPRYQARAERFRQCVDDRVDAACLDLLHNETGRPILLPATAKRSLILEARRLGGDGAFTRLVADTTAPIARRLAAAAGVPLDSLLAAWHRDVLAAEPVPTRVGPAVGWTSVLVVVLAGALALRSTRWRLG